MSDNSAMVAAVLAELAESVKEQNTLADRIIAAGNTESLVHEYREDVETDDENILKFRAFKEELSNRILAAEAQIDAYIGEKYVKAAQDFDVDAARETWKDANTKVKAAMSLVTGILGGTIPEDFPEVKKIPGTRGASAGSQTGTRRLRLQEISFRVAGTEDWTKVGRNDDEKGWTTNLTLLGQTLSTKEHKVGSADFQRPLFDAAGTEDLSTLEGKPVEFAFAVGDVNYEIRVTPKVND